MTRKELEELGLEKDVIDKVMQLNGQAIETLKKDNESLKSDNEALQTTNKELEEKYEPFKEIDLESLNKQVEGLGVLNAELEELKATNAELLDKTSTGVKQHALDKLAWTSGATDPEVFRLILDKEVKELEFDAETNSFKGIEGVMDKIKEDKSYLFDKKPITTGAQPPKASNKTKTVEEEIRKGFQKK